MQYNVQHGSTNKRLPELARKQQEERRVPRPPVIPLPLGQDKRVTFASLQGSADEYIDDEQPFDERHSSDRHEAILSSAIMESTSSDFQQMTEDLDSFFEDIDVDDPYNCAFITGPNVVDESTNHIAASVSTDNASMTLTHQRSIDGSQQLPTPSPIKIANLITSLHEWYAAGHFVPLYTSTKTMLADCNTKPLRNVASWVHGVRFHPPPDSDHYKLAEFALVFKANDKYYKN
jgi:hypothetical protein